MTSFNFAKTLLVLLSLQLILPGIIVYAQVATFSYVNHCREGWTEVLGTCVKVNLPLKTWEQADAICQKQGAHLLFVNSTYMERALEAKAGELGLQNNVNYYIGLKASDDHPLLFWKDGNKKIPATYTPAYWPGATKHTDDKRCTLLRKGLHIIKIAAKRCVISVNRYICQYVKVSGQGNNGISVAFTDNSPRKVQEGEAMDFTCHLNQHVQFFMTGEVFFNRVTTLEDGTTRKDVLFKTTLRVEAEPDFYSLTYTFVDGGIDFHLHMKKVRPIDNGVLQCEVQQHFIRQDIDEITITVSSGCDLTAMLTCPLPDTTGLDPRNEDDVRQLCKRASRWNACVSKVLSGCGDEMKNQLDQQNTHWEEVCAVAGVKACTYTGDDLLKIALQCGHPSYDSAEDFTTSGGDCGELRAYLECMPRVFACEGPSPLPFVPDRIHGYIEHYGTIYNRFCF